MANLYPVFLVLLISDKAFAVGKISLACTQEFCDEYVQRFPCPPLDPACSDPNKSVVIPSPTPCNCCEHCFIFQDVGENCVIGRPGQPLPKVICKPGTTCENEVCVKRNVFLVNDPDPDFYRGYECIDGNCYCAVVEGRNIKQIFGSFKETEEITQKKQCGCSISAYLSSKSINNVLSTPNAFVPTPRCLPNGQFDPLQCINDVCGCVNSTTGAWDSSVRKVFVQTLRPGNPICFDAKFGHKIGQYYKKCEKERNGLMADLSWADSGELEVLLSRRVECRPDGEYVTKV